MKRDNRQSSNYFFITFLVPIVGLLISLFNWRKPWAKNIFWMVCVFMGGIQIFQPEGTILGVGGDSGRYVLELINMHNNVNSFSELAQTFYDGETNDLFQPTLTFLVSRFTDNGHVLFFVLAIIYGFFYSRNVWYVLDKLPERLPKGIWVLVAYLFLVCPIWAINGFRMWTALHVFVYGALPFVLDGKKDKLIWSLLSILIHHSFIFPIALLVLFFIIGRSTRNSSVLMTALFVFYLFSLTVKTLNLSAAASLLGGFMPDYYDSSIETYLLNEEYFENVQEASSGRSAYIGVLSTLKFWGIQILVILSYLSLKQNKEALKQYFPIFSFSLLFSGFAHIASLAPSGGRFSLVALMFMVPAFLLIFTHHKTSMSVLFGLPLILIGIALLFDIRQGLDFYGSTLILGNFITIFLFESNVPLITFIKQMI